MAGVPVTELMGRVDEHVAGEGIHNVLQDAIDAAEGIRDGGTSGSRLADLIIVRSGMYIPEMVQPYLEAEQQIADNVGEIAVVVVSRSVQDRLRTDDGWQARVPHGGKFLAGRITDPEVLVDIEGDTWAIPTGQYFTPHMGEMNIAGDGPMPVADRLPNPSVSLLNATLGRELSTETMTRNSGDHIPYQIPYRIFQETALYIGQAAIDEAGYGVMELVPSEEALASGMIGRHTESLLVL
jgi:hypothetical protein